jgi:diguanylate cyclase (GGDEF)-like protein
MFIDFDRFKLVNDSLGHSAGDELLQQLARRVQERIRPSDTVARLGGDEFAILIENLEHERDAVLLADRLMDSLKTPFRVAGQTVTSSASIGITFSAFGYDSADAVPRPRARRATPSSTAPCTPRCRSGCGSKASCARPSRPSS